MPAFLRKAGVDCAAAPRGLSAEYFWAETGVTSVRTRAAATPNHDERPIPSRLLLGMNPAGPRGGTKWRAPAAADCHCNSQGVSLKLFVLLPVIHFGEIPIHAEKL